jgi:hypothetical protein
VGQEILTRRDFTANVAEGTSARARSVSMPAA